LQKLTFERNLRANLEVASAGMHFGIQFEAEIASFLKPVCSCPDRFGSTEFFSWMTVLVLKIAHSYEQVHIKAILYKWCNDQLSSDIFILI